MAHLHKRRSWQQPGLEPPPENVVLNRREWLKLAGFSGLGALAALGAAPAALAQNTERDAPDAGAVIPNALKDLPDSLLDSGS